MSLREAWKAADRRRGHFLYEVMIPVTRLAEWLRKRKKPKSETVWKYECGCHYVQAQPYCMEHGMSLDAGTVS